MNKIKTVNNRKIKVLFVFGTRPEAVKLAPVILKMKADPRFDVSALVTAQHREMLDSMLGAFGITPDYDLNIMSAGQTLADITAKALGGVYNIIGSHKPDLVLVHGDTTTTFASALASFYQGIPVGHVEAGLRTFNKLEPYPEEVNRRMTASLSDLHFAPTALAKQNLIAENIPCENIFVTGNTEIDAVLHVTGKNKDSAYVFSENALNDIDYTKKIIVMTAHRRENLGTPLENICRAIKRIIKDNEDCVLVYAVHLNPLVSKTASDVLGGTERVLLTPPLGICDMFNLMARSYMIYTDSGGLQESVTALQKPAVVLRNVTERPEGVDAGALVLAGTDEDTIYRITSNILHDRELYAKMSAPSFPYGDGKASERIIEAILGVIS